MLLFVTGTGSAAADVAEAQEAQQVHEIADGDADPQPGNGVRIHNLPRGVVSVELHAVGRSSRHFFLITWEDGREQRLTPNQFARLIYDDSRLPGGWWYTLLNISAPWGMAWVGLGLLGQLLFTGRMLVQWLASERSKRSVVPPAFWWMSLLGASMLMAYFFWRRDVVGVLGQGVGWFIYLRNIWLIHRPSHAPAATSEMTHA